MAKGIGGRENESTAPQELGESVSKALDAAFCRQEETYDDFLGSFIFLKKGLFKKSSACTAMENESAADVPRTQHSVDSCDGDNMADITTEELGPGDKSGTMAGLSAGRIVKLDNLVGSEEDFDLESEDVECRYIPSAVKQSSPKGSTTNLKTHGTSLGEAQDKLPALEEQNTNQGCRVVASFPGEVTPPLKTTVTGKTQPNIRCLEVSARPRPSMNTGNKDMEHTGEETCVVEPFQLDTDFDYDNVPYTPKFDFLQIKPP